jgi:hypothetical protein
VEVTVVRFVHVAPASVEVQMSRPFIGLAATMATATRWLPVESDATDHQSCPDAGVPLVRFVQVMPVSVDVQMSPFALTPFKLVTATRCLPVESEATSFQGRPAAAVPDVRSIQMATRPEQAR